MNDILAQGLRHRLRRSREGGNILVVLGGHALRLALGLISSALLARTLGPAQFRLFAVLGATMMLGLTVADWGMSNSAVRAMAAQRTSPPAALATARALATLKLLGALAVALLLVAAAGPLGQLLTLPPAQARLLLALAALGVLTTAASGTVSALLQGQERFVPLIGMQSVNISVTLLLVATLAWRGALRLDTALAVGAASALAGTALGVRALPAPWRTALRGGRAAWGAPGRALLRWSGWVGLSTLLAIATAQADLLLANRWLPPDEAGRYALALNLFWKANMLQQSTFAVLLPTASALAAGGSYRPYLRASVRRSALLALPLLPAIPLGWVAIPLVYGEAFAGAAGPLALLLLLAVSSLVLEPLMLLAYPLDLPRWIVLDKALALLTLLLLAAWLIPSVGAVGAALAKLLAMLPGSLLLGSRIVWALRQRRRA